MSKLFEPLAIRSVELKNRIVVSPMCQYSSEDGFANDWHLVHLGSRAVGGAALIITEAAAVSPEGRISARDLGIWKDAHIENLKRITAFIDANGAVAGIQLAHAGRKASVARPWEGGKPVPVSQGGWQPVAPSPVPFYDNDAAPHELTPGEIKEVTRQFAAAARRSLEAGFRVIELHAAHGYLVHQFLSPLANFRKDEYGGSFENRTRLLLGICDAVRTEWPESLPLFVRVSATDWAEGGWTLEESTRLAALLKEKGVDLIDSSSGGLTRHQQIKTGPGYQVPFAAAIREGAGIKTGAVGLITSAEQAEQVLEDGLADLILLAREFLRDAYFPFHAANLLDHDLKWPVQYERAK
ncbi:NADH:flavin oxidoreductase/NADH oxidase [Hufsiella ginkgonis]|uniref:Oxidoreductase n=1 Tax=Hufsiella ginkgonis TaxID=2695274 RepID=A0A7K1XV75_9SPHI|nr:NADH:flavin oxidoreductase/NADH oxidase [Hufsiella ginkgonis]MXV14884.1 oxidoreductase [Hufsiella ginkgonis]